MTITQEQVKELFEYKDGNLYWRKTIGHMKQGSIAGSKQSKLKINNYTYYLPILIFLYHHGYTPESIFYADGNATNNKIENIHQKRKVTKITTQKQVLDLFDYKDGTLFWKQTINRHAKKDQPAGTVIKNRYDYVRISLSGIKYRACSLIFLYHHGYDPRIIHHLDGNPLNNKIENLAASSQINQEISQAQLCELFEYRAGDLYWKKIVGNGRVKIGDKAGYLQKNGYRKIHIKNKTYGAHRLIFMFHYGYMPKIIDHINGNPTDNRIENLRECSQEENARNRKKPKTYAKKSSNFKGVCYQKSLDKWVAHIKVNAKSLHLGYFNDEGDAAMAYDNAARLYFGVYARSNFPLERE